MKLKKRRVRTMNDNRPRSKAFAIAVALWVLPLWKGSGSEGEIVSHPRELSFPDLRFEPPRAEDHRFVLSNGVVVYLTEDPTLPAVSLQVIIRTGDWLDPPGKEGLAGATAEMMRTGGAGDLTADELDERIEFLAINLGSAAGGDQATVGLWTLGSHLDEAMGLLGDVLFRPRFEEPKLVLWKARRLEAMRSRYDHPDSILRTYFRELVYGEHPITRRDTKRSIDAITRRDLVRWHRRWYRAGNMMVAGAGDFRKEDMLRRLEGLFEGSRGGATEWPDLPEVSKPATPGVFAIDRDINQGNVIVGHLGVRRSNPDIFALRVMDYILGSGSFTSRLMRIRAEEGLAYAVYSRLQPMDRFPGLLFAGFQTKSASVPYAISICLEEIDKLREHGVTDDEVTGAKKYFIGSFPAAFERPARVMQMFADLEYYDRPRDYFQTYRERVDRVTPEEVHRVAREYLHPGRFTILVVGRVKEVRPGTAEHPKTLDDFGKVEIIPLRDPLE